MPVVLCDVSDLSYEQIAARHRRADRHRALAHPPRPAPAARQPHRRRGDRAVIDRHDPSVLSGYLDGELDADERAEVEARLAESPEWRAELDAVRARTRRRRADSQVLEPRAGFWDDVTAAVRDAPPTARRTAGRWSGADRRAVRRPCAPRRSDTAAPDACVPGRPGATAVAAALVAVFVIPGRDQVRRTSPRS